MRKFLLTAVFTATFALPHIIHADYDQSGRDSDTDSRSEDNNNVGIGPNRQLDSGNSQKWGQWGQGGEDRSQANEGVGIGQHRRLNSGDSRKWGQWD